MYNRNSSNKNYHSNRGSSFNRNFSNNVKCHYCNRFGHISKNCTFKQNRANNTDNCNLVSNEGNLVSFLLADSCFNSGTKDNVRSFSGNVKFYLDSATTKHIVNNRSLFFDFIELDQHEFVTIAKKNVKLEIIGVGNIRVESVIGFNIVIRNVSYAKDIPVNLLSVRRLAEAGFTVVFYSTFALKFYLIIRYMVKLNC